MFVCVKIIKYVGNVYLRSKQGDKVYNFIQIVQASRIRDLLLEY